MQPACLEAACLRAVWASVEPFRMLRYVTNSDPAGHRGEHHVVCRRWLGTTGSGSVVVIDDGCTAIKDGCLRSRSRHLLGTPWLLRSATAKSTKVCSAHGPHRRLTVVRSRCRARLWLPRLQKCTSRSVLFQSLGKFELHGKIVREEVSLRSSDCLRKSINSRLLRSWYTDFHLRDHLLSFLLLEGGTGLRAPTIGTFVRVLQGCLEPFFRI